MAADITPSGIADRYAKALFDLADQEKALDAVADDLKALKVAIGESPELSAVLRSPVLARAEQAAAMDAILTKAGAGELVRKFVGLVARNRRLFALPRMIDAYLLELSTRRGEITAYITASHPLSDTQRTKLIDTIKQAVGTKVAVEVDVDSRLISGLIVRVGSRMVDSSLRSKLERMRLTLTAA